MSSEYNIHYDVNELLKILEIDEKVSEGVTADAITDNFIKSIDQKSKTRGASQTFYRKLETHSDPDFKNKYQELKLQNVIELDPLVHLLTRINDDQKIKSLLKFQNKSKSKLCANSKSNIENVELDSLNVQRSHSLSTVSSCLSNYNTVNNKLYDDIDSNGILCNDEEKEEKVRHLSRNKSPNKKDLTKKNNRLIDWKFLTLDYQPIDWSKEIETFKSLKCLPLNEQENALIEDLLFVLIGIEGKYIRLQNIKDRPNKHNMVIDNTGDQILYTHASRIIALCPYYSHIIHFIDEINAGLVNQSLVAAMRTHMRDYFTLISQLEIQHRRNELSLQKMWYYLQPCFTNLEILKHIASNIMKGNCSGGSVLSILHEKTISLTGNTKAQEFCLDITKKASEPYFEILEKWVYEGIIDDPYKEFFVEDRASEDDETVSDDLYWENRYSVVRSRIPIFFERHSDIIMKTGKYLSVIRQCGREITRSLFPESLVYTTEERVYIDSIEAAYKFASEELLHLLVDKSDLIGRLKSIKHYFLMDQGDFIVQFMDLAKDELEKEINDIAPNRLDSLLELSLRTSMMNSDQYKDDVRIELLSDSLHSQMSNILNIGNSYLNDEMKFNSQSHPLQGSEALALKFVVSWPLSLIISKRNITCYQMLFRHLFYCKYVERQLEEVWVGNKIAKRFTLNARIGYAQAFALRQKMLNFVQNLEYYIMLEVIEPTFHQFIEYVQTKVASVDEMMKSHEEYIQKCLRDGMLTVGDILQSVIKLLRLCSSFSKFMKDSQCHSTKYELLDTCANIRDFVSLDECVNDGVNNVQLNQSFEDHVANMHKDFNLNLHELLHGIKLQTQENYTMLPVLNRLDFNGFYESLDLRED